MWFVTASLAQDEKAYQRMEEEEFDVSTREIDTLNMLHDSDWLSALRAFERRSSAGLSRTLPLIRVIRACTLSVIKYVL